MVIQAGNTHFFPTVTTFHEDKKLWVVIEDGSIYTREDLWENLKQSLLKALAAKRVVRRQPGRPAKGPGSQQLGGDAARVAKLIHAAYADITSHAGRPAQYAEVARRLQISTTTLWRWRQHHAWPPEEAGTL